MLRINTRDTPQKITESIFKNYSNIFRQDKFAIIRKKAMFFIHTNSTGKYLSSLGKPSKFFKVSVVEINDMPFEEVELHDRYKPSEHTQKIGEYTIEYQKQRGKKDKLTWRTSFHIYNKIGTVVYYSGVLT